jgi:hypothetical protein
MEDFKKNRLKKLFYNSIIKKSRNITMLGVATDIKPVALYLEKLNGRYVFLFFINILYL